jgi:hypothetical protein
MGFITADNVTAVFTVIATVAAIIAVIVEQRRSRFALGLDLLNRLMDKFEGNRLIPYRCSYANKMLGRKKGPLGRIDIDDLLTVIMDHFQEVGELTRKRIVSLEFAWSNYGYWLRYYRPLAEEFVFEFRKTDPSGWEDVDWLFKKFSIRDKKANSTTIQKASITEREEMKKFLEGKYDIAKASNGWMNDVREFLEEEADLKC